MKQLAARDFEDLLQVCSILTGYKFLITPTQCAIPVFDNLLPEPHNSRLLDLLFKLAHWHGLAKLRIHTDITLGILDQVTTSLGEALRNFQLKSCPAFNTKELRREADARDRKNAKKGKKKRKTKAGKPQGAHGTPLEPLIATA